MSAHTGNAARPYRVLVVGAGGIGRRHLDAFVRTARAEVSVCEPDPTRRQAAACDFPVRTSFASLDEALCETWGAAIVATPAHTHLPISRRITDAGIPLLLEKPLAVSPDGLAEWIASVERQGPATMVGYVFRCHPLLVVLREDLSAGRIGRPVQIVVQRGAHLPTRRPDYAATYYGRREQGGGVIHDILSHLYNAVEWLVGPIDRLSADAVHGCLPGVEIEDTVHVIARHGGVLAVYAQNQHQRIAEFAITVNGTEGSLRALFHENCLQTALQPDGAWVDRRFPALDQAEWFRLQAERFLDMAEGRAEPPCSLAQALVTLRALMATFRSAEKGGAAVVVE